MPILKHLCEEWERQALSHSEMSRRSGIPDSTLRRLRRNPEAGANIETIISLARALNVSIDELAGLTQAPAGQPVAAALQAAAEPEPAAVKPEVMAPCHSQCPFRQISDSREQLFLSKENLYERALARKNKWITTLAIVCGLLVLAWIILFFIDITNPSVGWFKQMAAAFSTSARTDFQL